MPTGEDGKDKYRDIHFYPFSHDEEGSKVIGYELRPENKGNNVRRYDSNQARYLRCYLQDLNVNCTIVENDFYDWDYLAQYKEFYSTGANLYSNRCKRIHFFQITEEDIKAFEPHRPRRKILEENGSSIKPDELLKALFKEALRSDLTVSDECYKKFGLQIPDKKNKALNILQEAYRGFIVRRPLHRPYLGRTVLAWCGDRSKRDTSLGQNRRIRTPIRIGPHPCSFPTAREYMVHIAGIALKVDGLAWQQQDQGTGACGTVSLWSALQSRMYPHLKISSPKLTKLAHAMRTQGERVFPSRYLHRNQIADAIRQIPGCQPVVIRGDISPKRGVSGYTFSIEHFCQICLIYLRGGFPLLVSGNQRKQEGGKDHMSCITGFMVPQTDKQMTGSDIIEQIKNNKSDVFFEDTHFRHFFIHDDNIGPNVRVRVTTYEFLFLLRKAISYFNDFITLINHLSIPEHAQKKQEFFGHWKDALKTWQKEDGITALEPSKWNRKCDYSVIPAELIESTLNKDLKDLQTVIDKAIKMTGAQFTTNRLNTLIEKLGAYILAPCPTETLEEYDNNHCKVEFQKDEHNRFKKIFDQIEKSEYSHTAEDLYDTAVKLFHSALIFLNTATEIDKKVQWQSLLYNQNDQTNGKNFKTSDKTIQRRVVLVFDPPLDREGKAAIEQYEDVRDWPTFNSFTPHSLHIAVPEEIVTLPDQLLRASLRKLQAIAVAYKFNPEKEVALEETLLWTSSCRFVDQVSYFEDVLPSVLSQIQQPEMDDVLNSDILRSKFKFYLEERSSWIESTREKLYKNSRLMSKYIGLVRFGIRKRSDPNATTTPIMDILFDTTDSDQNQFAIAHVIFQKSQKRLTELVGNARFLDQLKFHFKDLYNLDLHQLPDFGLTIFSPTDDVVHAYQEAEQAHLFSKACQRIESDASHLSKCQNNKEDDPGAYMEAIGNVEQLLTSLSVDIDITEKKALGYKDTFDDIVSKLVTMLTHYKERNGLS
ncbi:MAG: hypothetical protein HQL54_01105 [Magnetococcales bacterium]|nr:hypothetical protein [Magnetococcales bacterium]